MNKRRVEDTVEHLPFIRKLIASPKSEERGCCTVLLISKETDDFCRIYGYHFFPGECKDIFHLTTFVLEKFTLLMSVYRYGHHDIGFAVSFLQNESKVTILYVQWIVCKRVRGIGYPQSIAIPIRAYTDTAYRLHQTWNNNIAPPVKWRVGGGRWMASDHFQCQ